MINVCYLETIHWNSTRSGYKLQEPRSHFVAERKDDPPVPLDHDVVRMIISLVNSVVLPVLDVNATYAAHKQLQLSICNEMWREEPFVA